MLLGVNSMMAQFSGSGTSSDPYLISSESDLYNFVTAVNSGSTFSGKYFMQTVDIDLVEPQYFSNGFTPIGGFSGDAPFSGTYDGGGHSISKMTISGYDKVAMFTNLQNGSIKNLNLENINFNVNSYSIVSGLVAQASNSTVSNVVVSGQMSASGEMTTLSFAGIVGQATNTSISGCLIMLTVDTENAQYNSADVAGVANADSRTTVTNCFVSTNIRGNNSSYYPIVDNGTVTRCLVAESNRVPTETESVTYDGCFFDHQNTLIAEFPIQETYIFGFIAKPTAELISGSLFNDTNWTETSGMYPRPAAVANTNSAILAATPMILNSNDCISSVVYDFTVSTANGVGWDSESGYLQVSGENVLLQSHPDSIAEIYAYRNNLVKNIQLIIIDNAPGSRGNPYRISSEEDLRNLSTMFDYSTYTHKSGDYFFDPTMKSDVYFLVDSDILISADSEWEPIGTYYDEYNFSCHFDGGNHTITFEDGAQYYAPLFGYVMGATISNLTVSYGEASIGGCYVGGIMEEVTGSVISNCKITGNITFYMGGECYTAGGGIAGYAAYTKFYNCVNAATIYASDAVFGGIVGNGVDVELRSCSNIGILEGESGYDGSYISGIIGTATDCSIINCANYGFFVTQSSEYTPVSAIVGSADTTFVYGCANYGENVIPLAVNASFSTFENNICVPSNFDSQSNYADVGQFILENQDNSGGNSGDDIQVVSINYISNNYTDKQLIPFVGNSYGIEGLFTNELVSGNIDGFSDNEWVFVNGRYPMPLGTDLDDNIVKLATTPIFLNVTSDNDYNTSISVLGDFTLPSNDGITWSLDTIPLTGTTVNLDSLRLEAEKVNVTLISNLGEETKAYNLIIPAVLGSPENPLLIESLSDFNDLSAAIASTYDAITYKGMLISNGAAGLYFKLTADIQAEQGSTNVVRVSQMDGFSGNFNGGGHTITVTTSDLVANSACGLFPTISSAKIDSLNVVVNGNVDATSIAGTSGTYPAVLCSKATNSTISNCTVTMDGTFTGNNGALICGLLKNSNLIGCSTFGSGTISLGGNYIAGVVNISQNSTIDKCTNNVKIEPDYCNSAAAGIVGKAYSLVLENCVNNGDIILNAQCYAAGIVGELLFDASNGSTNLIRTSLNNGYVYVNDGTGGKACGILGGYSTNDGIFAEAKVEKCVNAGRIVGLDYACGIAGYIEGEVSNCANYGSLECSHNIAGIKYGGYTSSSESTSVGNVVASRMTNSYAPYYNQDVISSDADEDDFFDEQITEIKVDSLRLRFYDNGTPRTTQMMVSSAFAEELPGDWDFTEGLYPLPAGLDPNDPRNKLARLPVILNSDGVGRSERITSVLSNITLPQVDGVTWESSNPDVISVSSGGGVAVVTNPGYDAEVTITATCEGLSRSFTFTVHSADGVTANNPIILTNCSDILYYMCNNEYYPSGGYGFYFKLGNNVVINRYDIDGDVEGNFHVNQENLNVLFPSTYPFRGHFDGDGYSVVWQDAEYEGEYYGLFKYTDGAEISNLTMYYNDNGSYNYAGTLVGTAKATTIRNCAVYSNLSASDRVGGIADKTSDGTVISNCIFVGELSAKNIGGIVADATDTRIDNSISMLSKSDEGETLETGGAIVHSAKNVIVDSCLVIGDNYYGRINVVSVSNESVTASNCYYDKQVWIPVEGDTINNIGVTTRELAVNGLFNWSHSEGKYPVPTGVANLSPVTFVATPMLVGADDDVMHVTELGILNGEDVEWFVSGTNAISTYYPPSGKHGTKATSGFTVNCVEEPESAEIFVTYSDTTLSDQALYYNFTRKVTVTKGIVEFDVPENLGLICEGSEFTLSVNNGAALAYSWNLPEGLTADSNNTQSVTVHVDDNYLRDNDPANISVEVSFDGCVVPKEIEFTAIPSPSHYRVNDTAVCTGSDLTVNCVLDEGYEEYAGSFSLSWYDASDMNNLLTDDSISSVGYYIPILTEDRNLRIIARNMQGHCVDTLDVALSVNPVSPITVVSGEPNQQICEGEPMEPVVLSVTSPTYNLPEGIYAEYNSNDNQLTLSGRPFLNSQEYSYTIYGCGSSFSGTIDVSERRRIHTDNSLSQVVNLGEELDMIRLEDFPADAYITWESLDGTETFTTGDLGLSIIDIDRIDFLAGTPEMPGEYIYHINIPENGACPAITYDNFLGVYDIEELVATALDATLCEGETATLATVERPGSYGGDYVWTLGADTVGTSSRINLVPPVGTSTYEVKCGGKRMNGEFEIGDYVYEGADNGTYLMLKNHEISRYDYEEGYMIVNIEQDSLLLISLSRMDEVVWSQDSTDVSSITNYATVEEAMSDMNGSGNSLILNGIEESAAAMLAADGIGYLPSAGELGYIINNYDKFYFVLEYDVPVILSSTEKDANTVYVLDINYGFMREYPKTELATAMGFVKISKYDVVEMVGRTSEINRTGSIQIIVSERHDMAISTDDVLCNTDTAHVGVNTDYTVLNWYNITNPETEVVYDEDIAVLTEGTYLAVASDEYASCIDTLEVKVKDLAFYIPQDTTVCDTAIFTIAKEDVIVMINGQAIGGQTVMLTESGSYTIALVGVGDTCREEKILNLIVNHSYMILFDTLVYESTFVWNDEIYTATGNYTQFFTTINGCDSIVTANVTFVNTETEFALFGTVTESDGTTPLSGVEVSSTGATATTSEDGGYLIMIQRNNPIVHFSKPGYTIICDSVSGGGEYNVSMYKPEINVSMSDDSYETSPYVARQIVVELTNTGDGPLAWSSVVESDFTAPDRAVHPRSNSHMWNSADDVIVTHSNAEQAIATDGFYIYTASWRRAGEFSRYSPDNGYLETFVIDGVGGVRNLSYGNGFFFATDNTNKIYKINMDTQTLEDVITLNDPDLQIRYCAYSSEEDLLYIGNWTNLYKLVAYNTAYPTLIPLSYSMDNVYSIAYDAFSGSTPCLWAFSQLSENNGPFAKIYKLNSNGVQIAEMEHFIDDASLATSSSLAGGICVSQYLYDDKYVLLANIQNSDNPNKIAVYEIGGKPSWVSSDTKSGIIPAGESINVTITEMATENGVYSAVVKFKPNVYMPQNTELNLSLTVSSPTCSPVENLIAETDTFHIVNLSWDAVEADDNENVLYIIYEQGSEVAIDTVLAASYLIENPEVGQHCYYVRTLIRGEADCVSNPSNTTCVEIVDFPCDGQLALSARAYGDRVRLEWNELFGVDHYEVHKDDLTGVVLYIGSETIFEDTLALPEIDNCYEVVAYFRNDVCDPKRSNSVCARISSEGCSDLPVLTTKAIGNSIVISWGEVQGVQSYSLYRDGKYITSTSDTVFYDMSLEYETEYCYLVEINCGYGMFGMSDEVCVTTESEYENAIETITDESIDLYPNPASDRFYIGGQSMKSIAVVNFAGQVVYELDNIMDDNIVIETESFVTGVYAVRITLSDGNTVTKRIVISK